MDVAQVIAIFIHTLALVIAWGYYGILGRIIAPALERTLAQPQRAATLAAIERRALPLVIASVVLLIGTGAYLLVIDPHYAGLGNLFATTWTTLLLVKHVLVIGLVGLGVGVDILIREAAEATTDRARDSATGLALLAADGATALGALIVLLTVIAQLNS